MIRILDETDHDLIQTTGGGKRAPSVGFVAGFDH